MKEYDLNTLRHSTSHILAHAVKELYPDVLLGIGPAIDDGFYYDFDTDVAFTNDDLARIESRMKKIVKKKTPFEHSSVSRDEALKIFTESGEKYKCELIKELDIDTVSLYRSGSFLDLCKGPHVNNTGDVSAFKLLSVAGAYWRGNSDNKMLTRIYGTAFFTAQELDEYLKRIEEAKKRDHRILGKQLDLFSFHDEAPGFPFFHPRGMLLYNELIDYWRIEHAKEGYIEVKTPLILRDELWKRSGHYDHYQEHMYFTDIENASFAVKPMNCPGTLLIYKSRQHSYRDLPIKMAELGLVHRHELSGVMHGLFRVKAFTIDDAHIFCHEDQISAEVSKVIQLIIRMYETFTFKEVHMELSTKPDNAMGSDEIWEKATASLKHALETNNIDYTLNEGEGAFYGPKIDFHIKDSLDRTWQCGTVQLDFSMPERFDLEYIGSDGNAHRPVMIHRAAFGSIERFLGILIEHFGGTFPLWLAPLQVRIMTISEKFSEFAQSVYQELRGKGIRSDLDTRAEKIGYKIREAENLKINYMVIVGQKEMDGQILSIRKKGESKNMINLPCDLFFAKLQEEIKKKS